MEDRGYDEFKKFGGDYGSGKNFGGSGYSAVARKSKIKI